MTDLEKLSVLFLDVKYREKLTLAKATRTCVRCKRSVYTFRDLSAKVEYEVSALCQRCQEELFK